MSSKPKKQIDIGLQGDSLDSVVPNLRPPERDDIKPGEVRGKTKVTIYVEDDVHDQVRRLAYWSRQSVGHIYQRAAHHHMLQLFVDECTFQVTMPDGKWKEVYKPPRHELPQIPKGARLRTGNFKDGG